MSDQFTADTLARMASALSDLVECLREDAEGRPELVQLNELLSIWNALDTTESRQTTLSVMRDLLKTPRH